MEKKIKAIFFDLDNTLYPTRYYAKLARENAIKNMIRYGLKTTQRESLEELDRIIKKYGSNYQFHFDKLLNKISKNQKHKEKIIAAGIIAYHKTKRKIKLYKNVKKVLKILKNKYKLYLVSEGIKKKQWEKIIRLGIEKYFDDFFITAKKTKKFYKQLLKKLTLKKENVLMVGDHPIKDWKIPKQLGIRIIKIKNKKYLADAAEKNYDFLEILKKIREDEKDDRRRK
ncbi:MAG: HAD-IA family hydrolase [Candidatus Anstonellaceae archaeon]